MANLKNVKQGDMLAFPVRTNGYMTGPRATLKLVKVERVTATQLACANGTNVRISDGKVIGKDYTYAVEATPEVRAKIEAEALAVASHDRYAMLCLRIKALNEAAISMSKYQDAELVASLESTVAALEAALAKANGVQQTV